jgi:2-polyprenyl-3-methyl-5-hydroxy-6-metoxy-1,4-benzoquinol methylase
MHVLPRRYLEEHLPRDGCVLDGGAATGGYSVARAKRGYSVTAVDLSSELIDRARLRVGEEGARIGWRCQLQSVRRGGA